MGLQQQIAPSVAHVFAIDELARRPGRYADSLQEKVALQDLAARMLGHPEEVLPRFVDLAMEMTGGIAAGLSLFEENPAPGVFRWTCLRGTLAPFEGATTPRNFSPCGVTLDHNGPVLSVHPERVYGWIADASIIVPEVLLVPLYIGSDVPLGTLWIVSADEGHFDSGHARAMTELASFVGVALRMTQTERKLKKALDEQETLTQEMSHRIKNLFALTDGMVRVSAKGSATKEEMTKLLSGRLHALASANALILPNVGGEPRTGGADLAQLLQMVVRPYEGRSPKGAARFVIEGPPVPCADHALSGVAMSMHELATNAAKYGALQADDGQVSLSWQKKGEELVLQWIERGGPPVDCVPAVTGFGSKLLQNTIVRQFGGTLNFDWQREGLAVSITLPYASLVPHPAAA